MIGLTILIALALSVVLFFLGFLIYVIIDSYKSGNRDDFISNTILLILIVIVIISGILAGLGI
jgi:heme/copper-type cytochrome/quinol oxidase subunit 2